MLVLSKKSFSCHGNGRHKLAEQELFSPPLHCLSSSLILRADKGRERRAAVEADPSGKLSV